MTIGALLDLGVDEKTLINALDSLNLDGFNLHISQKLVKGIKSIDFDVELINHKPHHGHHHHHEQRNLGSVEAIIDQSILDEAVKDLSKRIFMKVAEAEAKVHGKPIDEVHFHEVGAIDSIVDIVGTAICINHIKPDKIYASPLHVGLGTVSCTHGVLPVPAPATVEILENIPVYSTVVKGELVTPTGAAIVKAVADDFIPFPKMVIEKTGYGAGKKDYEIANLLRIVQGIQDSNL